MFSNKILIIRVRIDKILARRTNREDPDQTASTRNKNSLIWVFTVCLCLLARQQVFKILEYLSYQKNLKSASTGYCFCIIQTRVCKIQGPP